MVEKKLNFNRPILSVRRCSTKTAPQIDDQREGLPVIHWLPPHRPEQNSGHVRNPVSVPFLWEQSPGQPKEEILAQSHDCARPQASPELPPSTDQAGALQEETNPSSEPVANGRDDLGANALARERKKAVVLHCRPSFDQYENVITVCCLLPRSCLKSSVFNMNPVPAMSRVMTFPGSRTLSESGSSTDSENEYAVIQSHKKSFKTLQELLADDGLRNVDAKIEDSDSDLDLDLDLDLDSGSGDEIRLAVNKAAENARKRAGRGGVVPPPPLPESPSDSWLSRTLSSASMRKASSSGFVSRASPTTTESYSC